MVAGVGLWLLRPSHITALAEGELAQRLNMQVSIGEVSLHLLPRPSVEARDISLRLPNEPSLPPFVRIDHIQMNVGLLSMMRKHVATIHADGLRIAVPPEANRHELPGGQDVAGTGRTSIADVIVDRLITHDAELRFVPAKADDTPLVFAIPDLEVDELGFDREMPFTATVVNPTPRGTVRATGHVGPWQRADPIALPLSGDFTFEDADLSTINGINGWVNAIGRFGGHLTSIDVTGRADVRDFSLDLGGHPTALTAAFDAQVDGSDGTTVLKRVDATLGHSLLGVTGAIRNLPGPGRHDVDLTMTIAKGKVEDLLSLVFDSPKPPMRGDLTLHARLTLPPGPGRVRTRLGVTGEFGLAGARFTNAQVQDKLQDLSRRSQGKDPDEAIARVLTDLSGRLQLAHGVARLSGLNFLVPGAHVALDGSYDLGSGALDFAGTLRMQATVSQAVGGVKSIFIKPFDRWFKRDGAGAVLPIKIGGTRESPTFGLQVGKALTRQ